MGQQVEEIDALFVIHQDVDLADLGRTCISERYKRVLVVSTHCMFDDEVATLKEAAAGCEIQVGTFSDWLDDAALERCDDEASAALTARLGELAVRVYFPALFASASLYAKNAALRARLSKVYGWREARYSGGLGVAGRYWEEAGARQIGEAAEESLQNAPESGTVLRLRLFLRFLLAPTRLECIQQDGRTFAFTSRKRLAFRSGVKAQEQVIGAWSKLANAVRAFTLNPARILRKTVKGVLATTIHDYPAHLGDDAGLFHIFLDGFHPSNYPRTYIDAYGPSVFVTSDPFSVDWFRRHDRRVLAAPGFIAAEPMAGPHGSRQIKQVLLALNHAGDWTALINRSDTDRLVAAFCRAARLFPEVRFLVRPHPTMAQPAHEGVRSRARLEQHVRAAGLDNLAVSDGSLREDMDGSDIVASEYSQVLIDAFRLGKIGLIANLTHRRSFMVDYEACGFEHVDSETSFEEWLRATVADPSAVVARQRRAVARYNAAFDALMAGPRC